MGNRGGKAAAATEVKHMSSGAIDGGHSGIRTNLVQGRKLNPGHSLWDIYEKGRILGHGMTGHVQLITHRETKEVFALKAMDMELMNPELLDDLRNEIGLLRVLDHPNVIKLVEYYEDASASQMYLILEYCSGGELFDQLKAQPHDKFPEATAAVLVHQMLSAVAYCHKMGIAHRDLKLENFLFEKPWAASGSIPSLKLIDFGLSKKYVQEGGAIRRMKSMVGTPYYISPETLDRSQKYDEKCDIWSIGVLAYMLCSGRAPFKGRSDDEIVASVRRGKYTLSSRYWDGLSELAKNFVRQCLQYYPSRRPSAATLLTDPWMLAVRKAGFGPDGIPRPLHADVLANLRDFSQFNPIKRAALEVIAFSMTADSIAALRGEFAKLDTGDSGTVTHAEFTEALKRQGVSAEEADHIFSGMDQDQTAEVSYTEYLAAALSSKVYRDEARLREAFRRLDVDGSGTITAENLASIMGESYSNERIKAMIAEVDWKGEGSIDFEEFMALFKDESSSLVREVGGAKTLVQAGLQATAADAGAVAGHRHSAASAGGVDSTISSHSTGGPVTRVADMVAKSNTTGGTLEGGPGTPSARGSAISGLGAVAEAAEDEEHTSSDGGAALAMRVKEGADATGPAAAAAAAAAGPA
ncbi:hypothetical protein FNF27_05597 [Cafeteria roenbergensis]|nr:hypothetical protein FNF27_05597 [Cafeteria roenbergensis]